MPSPSLVLVFLLSLCFTLATQLSLWREQSDKRSSARTEGVLEVLMGDSRRLFANHFVTKADAYLHSGVYPSFFDQAQRERTKEQEHAGEGHPAADHHDHGDEEHHEAGDAVTGLFGKPRDWIKAFGRNFYPTRHTHLEHGQEREILPWLRLAAELNPNQIETYTVGAYWLARRMGKPAQAEELLRQGLRANPTSFELLFELGRLFEENHQDSNRARNLYQAALTRWNQSEASKKDKDQDKLAIMEISGHLARLEQREGHLGDAVHYLELLQKVSPDPEKIGTEIADIRQNQAARP